MFIVGFLVWALASSLAVCLVCVKRAYLKRCLREETLTTPTPSDPNTSQIPLLDIQSPTTATPTVSTATPTVSPPPTPSSDTTLKAEEDCIAKRTRSQCVRKLVN